MQRNILQSPSFSRLTLVALLSLSLLFPGCSTTRHKEKADAEVYAILQEKSELVPNAEADFSIDPPETPFSLDEYPKVQSDDRELGLSVPDQTGSSIINLEQSVLLAVQQNRSYQNAKEALFLQILALTLERHRYAPIFSDQGGVSLQGDAVEKTTPSEFSEAMSKTGAVITQLENLTGSQADLLRAYADVVNEAGGLAGWDQPHTGLSHRSRLTGQNRFGVDKLMKGGGRIAASITTSFLNFVTGSSTPSTSQSTFNLALTQPLLKGAGRSIAAERLTQSERDALYALRKFTHYRKQFTVEVCRDYYRVLQQRDVVRNTWVGLENFRMNVDRERAFAEENLSTQAELGRMVQFQLDNENRYINAARQYQEDLDSFKILLGLSTDTALILDNRELDLLRESGLDHPEIVAEDAVQVALESRLDFHNEQDLAEDAIRRLKVAANALKPGVSIVADAAVPTTGENRPLHFDLDRLDWSLGLDFDAMLDKKAERNAYRSALIDVERTARQASLAEDTVKLEVRGAWRTLEQARRNYEVALESVRLSERRVEEQQLLSELGRATAQDQVDAQNDLIQSQNSLTSAIVAHTMARLGFWRDMGILYISNEGLWTEIDLDALETAEESENVADEEVDADTNIVEGVDGSEAVDEMD
jgi:outer membrane protein TolC